ncbi:UDP-2,3-diacylglucosamine diphosphatase [Caldimonas brevitalea]|uniref:UDP-2,3-diacylglucosamine hydrolase n=1 Tax=Caldimonas brevitalea TaxID=413882 RepID=A0A0G3BGU1_9BURK|nr:UDP-2,3-diacylglucosamine diphosphatase [Caldimonas brevitalea]AKJ28664.1 UDP-2,3-diacylglucosamine hydrolase [Caldimonas brevitalea]
MREPAALPGLHALQAGADWRCVDLLSDLHLQADLPRTAAAFHRYLQHTPADAVLILGDLFEVWVGDDAADAGFEAQCAQWLHEAAQRRWIGFMAGNRDFLVGPEFLARCGLHALPDPTVLAFGTQRLLLTHGDALCIDDVEYQQFRAQVRSPEWQTRFLAQPLAERRKIAAHLRQASEQKKRNEGLESYADVDDTSARRWLEDAEAATLIHGHTHRPASHRLGADKSRHVLSDWDLDNAASGHPQRAEVLRLTQQGMTRVDLALAAPA